MTDDLEELLKTAANQVTDSLVTEVNSKMTSADSTAQKVEDNATEMNTLLSQVCQLNSLLNSLLNSAGDDYLCYSSDVWWKRKGS